MPPEPAQNAASGPSPETRIALAMAELGASEDFLRAAERTIAWALMTDGLWLGVAA